MSLAEVEFAFFFPVVWLLYWLGPRRAGWQNAVLLVASLVFYATWSLKLLPLLLLTTAIDYVAALWLGKHPKPEDGPEHGGRRWVLALSLVSNLGALGYFKYAGFFVQSLSELLHLVGFQGGFAVLHIALPIGISFYTMTRVGAMLDVYYGRIPACRSPLVFFTFVSFFPQVIAGPIGRGGDLLPQYEVPRRLDAERLASGAFAFLVGFFMKAYVAERVAEYVGPVFQDPSAYARGLHWLSLFAYATQVFCDFAGYSLLAIGTGRMFGLELPENFRRPLLSTSLMEFWRRWHISLNTWLFDYIYGPMTTGTGFMRARYRLGFIVVFLASGLWHGAMWTFVLWGFLHGVALVVADRWDQFYKTLCRKDRRYVQLRRGGPYKVAAWGLTQGFFLLTLIPFRAPSLGVAWTFAKGLVVSGGSSQLEAEGPAHLVLIAGWLVAYHVLDFERFRQWRERFFAFPTAVRGVLYGLVIVFLAMFAPVGAGAFIYAQF
ncbi:MAG: MBOAT family O-acyltransferase [Myxococcales bacterium]